MAAWVEIWWLPLGAGGHSVRFNGRAYEALVARRERRLPLDLYHAALQVRLPSGRYTIEMTPVRAADGLDRGVVAEGPVGARALGRWRLFRYEVRRWRGGVIPDVGEAVDSPRLLTDEPEVAWRVLELVPGVPVLVWGRDELGVGDMWNSNSLVAWLLARAGLDAAAVTPPPGGRAPGWSAGVVAARRLRAAVVACDEDRRRDHDRRDDVRHDQRPVLDRDPVREPEQEADEEHRRIPERDAVRASVMDHLADLKDGGDRHRDTPRRRYEREGGDHPATVPTIARWPGRPERS